MADGNGYAAYINRARSLIDFGDIEGIVEWKHGIIEDLREARRAVRAGNSKWPSLVRTGITRTDDIFGWRDPLNNWFRSGSEEALTALRVLWTEEPASPSERIRAFYGRVPYDVPVNRKGTGLRPVSVLLMALGADYPPFKALQFKRAYKATGHPQPSKDADEAALYEHAVEFLDLLIDCSDGTPNDRLEAETILWLMNDAGHHLEPSAVEQASPTAAWVIRAGREGERETYNLERGLASMGWGNLPDLQGVSSRHDVEAMIRQALPDARVGTIRNYARQLWSLRSRVQVGDIVVLPLKTTREIALGTVTQGYSYRADEEGDWRHVAWVDWRRTDVPRSAVKPDLLKSLGSQLMIYSITANDGVWRLHQLMLTGQDPGARPGHHEKKAGPHRVQLGRTSR